MLLMTVCAIIHHHSMLHAKQSAPCNVAARPNRARSGKLSNAILRRIIRAIKEFHTSYNFWSTRFLCMDGGPKI